MIVNASENPSKSDARIASANSMIQFALAGSVHRPSWHAGSEPNQPQTPIASAVMSSPYASDRYSKTECKMSAQIETGTGFAKRKETGARFVLNTTPMEFANYNCSYENPVYGLNIGILAIFTSETFALKSLNYGHVIEQPVATGIIFEKGRLKADIEQNPAFRGADAPAEAIIRDVYELAIELLMDAYKGIYDLRTAGVKIHIYEAATREFHHAFWTTREGSGPGSELIANLRAERVF